LAASLITCWPNRFFRTPRRSR